MVSNLRPLRPQATVSKNLDQSNLKKLNLLKGVYVDNT
jgi:hypothetical protein